ncbi:MAG: acyl-CoA/acyl-ACP dehydrogenase [Saccharothrix sp.]|nr:acyl-CoA/acyl-ACP dehydrogenase [Saccharothrix sp.]
MTSSVASPPTLRGFFDELFLGRVRWDLLRPFPTQDAADRAAGDQAVAAVTALVRAHVDPEALDRTGVLPDGLTDALQDGGFYQLLMGPELGGLALSPFNAMRVVEAVASWSPAVAWSLAIGNGFGSGSYLPIVEDGPLRSLIERHVRAGLVSGSADTEANGAANHRRHTTAVPVGDGYVVNGEKVFIGNGPLARLLDVACTVEVDGVRQIRYFFVETDSPGFEVVSTQEFLGLKGASIGVLRFTDVLVPAENMLPASVDEARYAPEIARLATLARTLIIASPSLAIAKLCLGWQRNFVTRRVMDDRPLASYEEIQRRVAETAADVHLVESVVAWGLLGQDRADTGPDLTAAKNLTSLACWRAIDRTVGLLGGEGIETARSKARRGAPALPVERFVRDARGLRVAGGVDFLLDYWSAEAGLEAWYTGVAAPFESTVDDLALPPRCRAHFRFLVDEAARLGAVCSRLTGSYGRDELMARQRTVITLGAVARELLGMAVVLARAGTDETALLADIACASARVRLAGLWVQLESEFDFAGVADELLHGTGFDFLTTDVITDLPSVEEQP